VTESTFLRSSNGHWLVKGDLGIANAMELLRQAEALIQSGAWEVVDLSAVGRVDSGALTFMLELMRSGREHGTRVRFTHIPDHLKTIAEACGVSEFLPLQ
jgi:phospholipid transport system transporter-binding protein